MLRTILILFLICIWHNPALPVSTDERADHGATVLLEECEFRITGWNSAILKKKFKFLILNENGREYSGGSFSENEFIVHTDIRAVVTDLSGKELNALDEEDIHYSTLSHQIDDGKRYWFNLYGQKYPYIFEYEVEYEIKSLMHWPSWVPGFDIPAALSRYRLVQEVPVPFKYYSVGLDVDPVVSMTGVDSTWTWELKDIEPWERNYRAPPLSETRPKILFKALNYRIGDYQVSTQTWNDFARWIREMYQDQYVVDEDTRSNILKIAPDSISDREKIDRITRFLQENTRYVAVELGIGGWKPHPSDWVMKNKMGDCKDLSTCLVSLLNVVGIKAYPALIKTRDSGVVYTEFPSNQFNHVIVFVPLDKDTLWIETTSDYFSPGHLPYSDQGCNVLVIKEDTGEIIQTPVADQNENYEHRKISALLHTKTGAKFEARSSCGGSRRIWFDDLQASNDKDQIMNSLRKYMGRYENTVNLSKYNFATVGRELNLDLTGELANLVTQTGKRVFVNPNIFHRVDIEKDLFEKERTFPIYYDYPFSLSDTIDIVLPVTVQIESAPDRIEIETDFAYYKIDYICSDKTLRFIRKYEIRQRVIPAERYGEYLEFMSKVEDWDSRKFVLLKH